jgi:type IV secretory pathway TrbD component
MRALVRPELLLGCDRRGIILVGTCAFSLIGPNGIAASKYEYVLYGAVVLLVGVTFLRWLAKKDPQAIDVYLEAMEYRRTYVGRSRWDAERRSR